MALTSTAHHIIAAHFGPRLKNDTELTAIDATCGNGNDTLFLLQLGMAQVFAFDVQDNAIRETSKLCAAYSPPRLMMVAKSHAEVSKVVPQKIDCAMFNLGYLPGADRSITTQEASSVSAIEQVIDQLTIGGIMSVICYPGHPNGFAETAAVATALQTQGSNASFTLTRYDSQRPTSTTPVLFILAKH